MSVVVKNIGASHRGAQNQHNTPNSNIAVGDQGTVTVIIERVPYVFGPNESKTFADDGIGIAAAAADARLRIVDSRDSAKATLRT